jgi:hypothetical protein
VPFTADDRIAVTDLINMHGHLSDAGDLDRYDELFTPDVRYDVGIVLVGPEALAAAGRKLGAGNPVAHLVTNIVLTDIADDVVHAISKGLGVLADGTCGSVTYEDKIVRTDVGWRISERRVVARKVPLSGRF